MIFRHPKLAALSTWFMAWTALVYGFDWHDIGFYVFTATLSIGAPVILWVLSRSKSQ